MSELGDLLERIFDPRYTCVHARVRSTIDLLAQRRLLQRSGGASSTLIVGGTPGEAPPKTMESVAEVWLHADGRYRVDQGDGQFSEIGDSVSRLIIGPEPPAVRFDQVVHGGVLDRTPFDPASLVAHYQLQLGDRLVVAGRDAVSVRGALRRGDDMRGPSHLRMHYQVTDTAEFVFDRETGVLLRFAALDVSQPVSTVEVLEIAFDGDVDEADFMPPADIEVEYEAEHLLRQLADAGVEVSGLDPNDVDALRRARGEQMRAAHGFGVPDARARHQPTGPPPDDEDAARADITRAFEHMGDRNDDGSAENVQGGENLGPSFERASQHYPATSIEVNGVLFLDENHAVVWFRALAENGPLVSQEGRALVTDGRWKVARETAGALLALAGVHIPPPAA